MLRLEKLLPSVPEQHCRLYNPHVSILSAAFHSLSCCDNRRRGRQSTATAFEQKRVILDLLFIPHEVNISLPASRNCPEILSESGSKLSGNQPRLNQKIASAGVFSVFPVNLTRTRSPLSSPLRRRSSNPSDKLDLPE